ncbi:MAG: binding domain, excisionase family [Frankiales bacterium]|nr:binding domain, excisionase family [Frankiales bacterium]
MTEQRTTESTTPSRPAQGRDRLLTPGEVATLFRVDPKTVTRWAAAGRIGSIRTPGGHRRFRESEVRALLRGDVAEAGGTVPAVPTQPTGSTALSPAPTA